jgi:DNA modification methylase
MERYKYNFTGPPGYIYPNEKRDLPFNLNGQRDVSGRNKRTVWTVTTHPYPEAHFATFPEKLIEPCILAGCPKDGVVYDPFMGAGTTALVALRAERRFIGSEINGEYVKIAEKRIKPLMDQYRLAL